MPILAIDFGTTTTVAAVRAEGSPPRLVAIDGSPLLPSSVFLTESGTLTVGRDADRQARLDPSRYEPNPKRRIDDGEVMLGVSALPVVELIAAVLRRVLDEVRRQFGSVPADVRLTHPARWGRVRRQLLIDAARAAGLSHEPMLIPEPVAAATHYANLGDRNLGPDAGVAVYDLGGGTFDVAVLRRSGPTWAVVAEAGLADLGGVDFDHAIVEHLAAHHAQPHRAEWEALLAAGDPANRRLRRAFETDVRDCKEALSRYAQSEVPMPEPFGDALLTRTEFEELIRPQLSRTVDLLAEQLQRSEVPAQALSGVYLVGGSSRIPLVARLIQERLGITPTTLDQPETSVATGALLVPVPVQPGSGPVPQQAGPYGPPSGPVPQQYRPHGEPAAAQSGQVPYQSGQVPYQPGQAPHQPGQLPYQSGPIPQPYGQSSGPVGRPSPASPATKRNRRWQIPAAGVAVVAVVVVAVVLATRGGGKHRDAGGPTSPPATGSSQPTSTATGSATNTATNSAKSNSSTKFDSYFSDLNVRDYMRGSYSFIVSCDPEKDSETFCQLTNGLTVGVGNSVNGGRQSTIRGSSIVPAPSTSWQQKNWVRGSGKGRLRTWLEGDKPDKPLLYWDRNGTVYGILGIEKGDVTTTSAAALRRTWQNHFER